MPESIIEPAASRKSTRDATRGSSVRPAMPSINDPMSHPETRTMPMPPRPAGVAMAAIGGAATSGAFIEALARAVWYASSAPLCCRDSGFALEHPVHLPLLRNLQQVVDEPVQHEARGKEQEHDRECDRHELHHL